MKFTEKLFLKLLKTVAKEPFAPNQGVIILVFETPDKKFEFGSEIMNRACIRGDASAALTTLCNAAGECIAAADLDEDEEFNLISEFAAAVQDRVNRGRCEIDPMS